MHKTLMDISVVIPLLNEEESLPELHAWIKSVLKENKLTGEIIFVDDGSTDNSWHVIEKLAKDDYQVTGIKFRRNFGKSAALSKGFETATGEVVITMDADLQDSPDEIPELYRIIREEGFDLVSGWKKKRHDPIGKTWPSKLFNRTTRCMSGIKLHDFNCGLKAYRLEVVKNIEVYGEMHRYIPVLAKWSGYKKIGEKVVQHRSRKYGTTKFGVERFMKGYLDLLSVTFISRFGRSPMHLFGTLGTLVFIIGFLAAAWVGAEKLYNLHHGIRTILVTQSPYFYIALAMMIIGSQLFLTGFLGELFARNSGHGRNYGVDKTTKN
jgi:glycosyltransferase involved in cell wall biosynthesis